MLETGDFVDVRFQDEARYKKPVGIYWIQSASVAIGDALVIPQAHTTIALYRLPSLFGAIATVLLTYWAALAFFGRRGAFLTAALMATCVILMVEVAVMGGLARAYLSRGAGVLPRRALLIFWTGFALGILIKGPLVLMFAGLTAAVLSYKERSARWLLTLRPWLGLVFTLAVVLPWFIAIAVKSGGAFYSQAVGHDMLGKVGTAQKYHWAPPGFYLLSFFATFWPGAILAAIAVPFAWIHRKEEQVAFALAWIVPSWIIFEAVPTKLPHYTLPLLPAVAIVTVMAISRYCVGPHRPLAKLSTILIPFIPVGLTIGLSAANWSFDGTLPFRALPVLVAASAIALYAWWLFLKNRIPSCLCASFIASVCLTIGVFGFAQLDLRSLKVSDKLAETVQGFPVDKVRVAALGYHEPSLVFLVGTQLNLIDTGAEASSFLKQNSCAVVFVDKRFEGDFRGENERAGLQPTLSTRVSGFNINSGKRVDIGVYSVDSGCS
jgi:4-amino-4-deoxy-L-arabinose transferase-like glycosyltransferase